MKIGKIKVTLRNILFAVVVILLLIIMLQNLEPCNLRILFIRVENIPKIILIVASVLIGMGIQAFLGVIKKK